MSTTVVGSVVQHIHTSEQVFVRVSYHSMKRAAEDGRVAISKGSHGSIRQVYM